MSMTKEQAQQISLVLHFVKKNFVSNVSPKNHALLTQVLHDVSFLIKTLPHINQDDKVEFISSMLTDIETNTKQVQ